LGDTSQINDGVCPLYSAVLCTVPERKEWYNMANITKLPSGNFRARVFLGRDVNGKQIYKSFTADK
jgi:hypothetical protein